MLMVAPCPEHPFQNNMARSVDMEHAEETRLEDHVAGSGIRAVRSLRSLPDDYLFGAVQSKSPLAILRPRLPSDMWQVVCSYLSLRSLPRFRRICKASQHGFAMLLMTEATLGSAFERMSLGLEEHDQSKRVWVAVREKPSHQDVDKCVRMSHRCTAFRDKGSQQSFFYDAVFDGAATQLDVWSRVQPSVLSSLLQRKHVCFMAYGQTGSGKTHTMFGDLERPGGEGIAYRAVRSLATLLNSKEVQNSGLTPSVEFSFLEIYNEKVYDLLGGKSALNLSVEREVKHVGSKYRAAEYTGNEHVCAKGLTRKSCEIAQLVRNVGDWLQEGAASRTVGKTVFNERSSRSHAIATMHVLWGDAAKTETRMYLVDLAGSERAGQYALSKKQLAQGCNINTSLSTLARVVKSLASGSAEHVPYRDSTLTWLLSDAITGVNARAFMIATVHPTHPAETLSTLQYAQRYSSLRGNQEEINKIGAALRKALANVQHQRSIFSNLLEDANANKKFNLRVSAEERANKLTRNAVNAMRGNPGLGAVERQLVSALVELERLEAVVASQKEELAGAAAKEKKLEKRMSSE